MDILKDNIRISLNGDDSELRESMKGGWIKHLPALADENGTLLVGHRRLKIAKELGIEPVIQELVIGVGEEADVERLRLAFASNLGFKPMTKEDRQRIDEILYKKGWTMQRIADALGVSQQCVSKDLAGLQQSSKPSRPKGGRPKGSGNTGKGKSFQPFSGTDEVMPLHKEGVTQTEIAKATSISKDLVRRIVERETVREEGEKKAEEALKREITELKMQVWGRDKQIRQLFAENDKLKAALARPPRPQLDAESQAARTIKALRSEVANLKREKKTMILYKHVKMTPEVYRTIAKVLHPDRVPSAEERATALALFNDLFSDPL